MEDARRSWGWPLTMYIQERVLGGACAKGTETMSIKPPKLQEELLAEGQLPSFSRLCRQGELGRR